MLLRIMEDFDPETKLRIIVSNFEMGVFQTAIHQCTMDNPFKKIYVESFVFRFSADASTYTERLSLEGNIFSNTPSAGRSDIVYMYHGDGVCRIFKMFV